MIYILTSTKIFPITFLHLCKKQKMKTRTIVLIPKPLKSLPDHWKKKALYGFLSQTVKNLNGVRQQAITIFLWPKIFSDNLVCFSISPTKIPIHISRSRMFPKNLKNSERKVGLLFWKQWIKYWMTTSLHMIRVKRRS